VTFARFNRRGKMPGAPHSVRQFETLVCCVTVDCGWITKLLLSLRFEAVFIDSEAFDL
jgi:hypothetical protein